APGWRPVLIYGGGKKGKMLYDLIAHKRVDTNQQSNPEESNHHIIGFIDDDPAKVGSQLCGLPIKSPAQWLTQKWEEPPHIWISSKHIMDQHAIKLAERWEGKSQVKRMDVLMKVVNGSAAQALGSAPTGAKVPRITNRK
ncbi:MAG: hypothetical protein JSV54_01160, partial [Chloroflexota bacterium]